MTPETSADTSAETADITADITAKTAAKAAAETADITAEITADTADTAAKTRGNGPEADPGTTTEYARLRDLSGRGWTPAMIRDFLGGPDRTLAGGRFPDVAPVPLFDLARVAAAERTRAFRVRRADAEARSAKARAAAHRRRERILRLVTPEDIPVPRLDPGVLVARAVRHRDIGEDGAADPGAADASTLDRWKVNYLRHLVSRYDLFVDGLFGRAGRAEAERLMSHRVYAAIGKQYPELMPECARQLGLRDRGAA